MYSISHHEDIYKAHLDVLNDEIQYSDVKNITITRIDKSKIFVDNESMKKIYFLLYRYGKSTSR